MTNRDKLVELLESHCAVIGEAKCKAAKGEICSPKDCAGCLADHLIANGVTVHRWIPVTEKLPEDDENLRFYDNGLLRFTSVFVHDENRGAAIANRLMIRHHNIPSFNELATDGWVWSRPYEPTHWMPLFEPTKEV